MPGTDATGGAPPAPLLAAIRSPADLRRLPAGELPALAAEIRARIIAATARNGGHVGPNLGVVELTIALHRVFETPRDALLFDVSHQCYPHKLLTGRHEGFSRLRQTGGPSGFCNPAESPHDAFVAGHAGTALSAALGIAAARDLQKLPGHVVALCGDGAFTCGETLEALNNIATTTRRLVIILNDNQWSIGRNVGAIARLLARLSTSRAYNKVHNRIQAAVTATPAGQRLHRLWTLWKRETKDFFAESGFFEKFGLRHIGPIDGHNLPELQKHLEFARDADFPVLLHVITQKGRGLQAALDHPEKFHGAAPYNPGSGETTPGRPGTPPTYTEVFSNALLREADADSRVVAITAAMASGTGLGKMAARHPGRFHDVGIAEEHAATFAAGLAAKGARPVLALYSTFAQRAVDQIIHDIALQNLPVTLCLDRAGLSPADGPTHHGLYDIPLLRPVPNAVIMQPADEDELADMLHTALRQNHGPHIIRYPRGAAAGVKIKESPALLEIGKAQLLQQGAGAAVWSLGAMLPDARALAAKIGARLGGPPTLVNARHAKPLDADLLLRHAREHRLIVTLEDGALAGGFGAAVLETLSEAGLATPVVRIGWPDRFIGHGTSVADLRAANGLDPESIWQKVLPHLPA
ncbi:MAG: 1-deoxy-D-xylulose-5-phosphate synthase [Opitutaceae bacterium]|nr:1-deoxy-D-xylulose-5-phosphate synthase [Opitutaceae bacterium]